VLFLNRFADPTLLAFAPEVLGEDAGRFADPHRSTRLSPYSTETSLVAGRSRKHKNMSWEVSEHSPNNAVTFWSSSTIAQLF
jgi:hypothetical protein